MDGKIHPSEFATMWNYTGLGARSPIENLISVNASADAVVSAFIEMDLLFN